MCYGLIPPHMINIVKPSITTKPMWCAGFGQTMTTCAFYITTYKSGGEGKENIQTDVGIDRQENLIW